MATSAFSASDGGVVRQDHAHRMMWAAAGIDVNETPDERKIRMDLEATNRALAANAKLLDEHRRRRTVVRCQRLTVGLLAADVASILAAIWFPPHLQLALTAVLLMLLTAISSIPTGLWED